MASFRKLIVMTQLNKKDSDQGIKVAESSPIAHQYMLLLETYSGLYSTDNNFEVFSRKRFDEFYDENNQINSIDLYSQNEFIDFNNIIFNSNQEKTSGLGILFLFSVLNSISPFIFKTDSILSYIEEEAQKTFKDYLNKDSNGKYFIGDAENTTMSTILGYKDDGFKSNTSLDLQILTLNTYEILKKLNRQLLSDSNINPLIEGWKEFKETNFDVSELIFLPIDRLYRRFEDEKYNFLAIDQAFYNLKMFVKNTFIPQTNEHFKNFKILDVVRDFASNKIFFAYNYRINPHIIKAKACNMLQCIDFIFKMIENFIFIYTNIQKLNPNFTKDG